MLIEFFTQLFTWQTTGILFMLLIPINLGFGYLTPRIIGKDKNKAKIPDITFGYSSAELYAWFEHYGASGRQTYFYTLLILDTIYPLAYSVAFSLLLVGLEAAQWIVLVWAICIADFSENLVMLIALKNYPYQLPQLIQIGSFFTRTKWILLLVLLGVILAASVGFV